MVQLRRSQGTIPPQCAIAYLESFNRSLENVSLPIGVRYGMVFWLSLTCDGSIGNGCFVYDRFLQGPSA